MAPEPTPRLVVLSRRLVGAALATLLAASCSASDSGREPEPAGEAASAVSVSVTIRWGLPGSIVEDTHIDSAAPTTKFGSSQRLSYSESSTQREASLVRWDISSIPKSATVTKATASFRLLNNGAQGASVSRVLTPWTEANTTWNSFGGLAPLAPASASIPAGANALEVASVTYAKTVDLTQMVKDWVSGKLPNYGIAITYKNPTPSMIVGGQLASSEYTANVAYRPTLTVDYDTSPCDGLPDGTPCTDNNACTKNDVCMGNICVPGPPVICPVSNVCAASSCSPTTGQCKLTAAPNGTPCNDGNGCTQTDTCNNGACVGKNPVVCAPVDACHLAGVCNPAVGACTVGPSLPGNAGGNLVHRWTFDEPSGNKANDAFVYYQYGILGTSVTRGPGPDGTNALVTTPMGACDYNTYVDFNTNIVPNATSDSTVSFWIKMGPNPKPMKIISEGWSFGVQILPSGAQSIRYGGPTTTVSGPFPVNDGKWHSLAYVRKQNVLTVYVDGSPWGSLNYAPSYTFGSFRLGGYANCLTDSTVPVSYDDLRVYDRALSQCDVNAIATLPSGPASCGNDLVDPGEQCDEGIHNNKHSLSLCTPACKRPGVLAAWSGDDVNGDGTTPAPGAPVSKWVDLIGGKNAVQPNGSQQPTYQGGAVVFDGVNDLLQAPLSINYTPSFSLSVVAGFKNAAGGAAAYAGVWGHDNGGFDRYLVSGGNGPLGTGVSNGTSLVPVPGITATGRALIAATVLKSGGAPGSSIVYLDGKPAATFAESHDNNGSGQLSIGNLGASPSGSFKGSVDFLWVYDHALTPAEVYGIQTAIRPPCTSLAASTNGVGTVAPSAKLAFGPASTWSVGFWVFLSSGAKLQALLQKGNQTSKEWLLYYNPNGELCLAVPGSVAAPSCTAPGAVTAGGWRYIAMSYASGTARFYVNGAQVAMGSATIGAPQSTPLYVANDGPSNLGLQGNLADLAFWSKALSAAEVNKLHARAETPLDVGALIAWWPLRDGQGSAAVDVTNNGQDMALSNTTWAPTCEFTGCGDGVKNGNETDIDCGGGTCLAKCGVGLSCLVDSDCITANCVASLCQPVTDCYALHAAKPSLPDGAYLIDPDGPGGVAPFSAQCDMTIDGGGWTRIRTLPIPAGAVPWSSAAAVPYANLLPADPASGREMVKLTLDNSYGWASFDTGAADPDTWSTLGFDAIMQTTLPNGRYGIGTPAPTPAIPLRIAQWPNCFSETVATGSFSYQDVPSGAAPTPCHGQYAFYANTSTIFAVHGFAAPSGALDVGIGDRPAGGPNWALAHNAGSFAKRELSFWVRPGGCATSADCQAGTCVSGACQPYADCSALHVAKPALPDGTYLIDPDGPGGVPAFNALCDMTTDGGGWTRVRSLPVPAAAGVWTAPASLAFANLLPADPVSAREMVMLALDDTYGWASWDTGGADPDTWTTFGFDAPLQTTLLNGRYGVNTKTGAPAAPLRIAQWPNCYTVTPATGTFSYQDTITGSGPIACYGQYAFFAGTSTILAVNRWAFANGSMDVGVGDQPVGQGQPNWTFSQNANAYASRELSWWVSSGCVTNADCPAGTCLSGGCQPYASCDALHTARPALPDGVYAIDPDGPGGQAPFDTRCDMTTDGGGWTRIRSLPIPVNSSGWSSLAAVPYANVIPTDPPRTREMAVLTLDSTYAWASWDTGATAPEAWTTLGLDAIMQTTLPNGRYGINTKTGSAVSLLRFAQWPNCYSPTPATGKYSYLDVPQGSTPAPCYGQYAFYANTSTIFAVDRFAIAGGVLDIGIGDRPTGDPNWTFAQSSGAFGSRVLSWYVR